MIKIAIAVKGGHVSRAMDFFKSEGKYFIIGGTEPWTEDGNPPAPDINEFKLRDVVGLKRVDEIQYVVPDENGSIKYREQNWKIVTEYLSTTLTSQVDANTTILEVASLENIFVGSKLRINNTYDCTVISISGNTITVDTEAPELVPSGSSVVGGALVEGANYVYVKCYLEYDRFPLVTYRQIGLCTGVTPRDASNANILRSAGHGTDVDEYTSLGVLEILDNRVPNVRDINQRELLSLIIEF